MNAAVAHAIRAREAGRTAEAIAALLRAVSLDPRNATLHLELGTLLLHSGRPGEALAWFDKAVGLSPSAAQAHLRRGLALEQLGWHADAAATYRHTIELAPRLADAHFRLGSVLLMQDMRAEAAKSFHRAAALQRKRPEGSLSLAFALVAEGAPDEALLALRRVIALEPRNALAHAQLGKILAETGKADEAIAAFDDVLRISPRAVGHFYDLVRIRRLSETDRPLLDRMIAAMRREDIHPVQRIMLEMAVGKAYDDLDQPEQAMSHFLTANRLKGRIRPLDRGLITKRVDWQIQTLTRAFLAHHAEEGSTDSTPILVLGMPRSGTTLVESVLSCHSRVNAGQELSFWSRVGRGIVASGEVPAVADLREIAGAYLGVLRGISVAPHVTDKKPDNFFWAGLVHVVFPQARIVHCRRNAMDTCVSILTNFFAPRPDFSTEPADLIFYYREYERLMAHWRDVLPPDRFLDFDYEALVSQPEPAIRRLLEFCGLDWETTCMHPERSTRRVDTASLWQIRQPIFTGSVQRWRRYEPWLAELRALLPEEERMPDRV